MTISNFWEDETLTDNLDDDQASRLLEVLGAAEVQTPAELDLLICLTKIINVSAKSDKGLLFEELICKLEEKYVKSKS